MKKIGIQYLVSTFKIDYRLFLLKKKSSNSSLILQVFHEELFGNVAEEKNVDAIKGKVFEAKTMKSYDSYQILAKFIGMGALSALLQPLKQVSHFH